jgi:virulence factor Mce-like protein
MKRIVVYAGLILAVAFVVIATGASSGPSNPTYKLEFGNAFGLVNGAPFKVAGVPAGSITSIDLCAKDPTAHCRYPLDALVTVQVTTKGFGAFRSDASCQSRPQSLIGEYFVDCQPGQYGKALDSGATLPTSHTFSTIPADLLANIMRLPQRERFSLIINELGAAVAGRSEDLQTALQRAVPALTETDNLLNLLANDSQTLQQLTANSDAVITALADNSKQVQNFIVEAGNAARDTATQQANLRTSLQRFPGLLEQLRPTMAKLGAAADAQAPMLANLNTATGHVGSTTTGPDQLRALFTNLGPCSQPHAGNQCGFPSASLPALQSLGQASITGKQAVQAATPTVALLNKFAQPTPELAQNLAIVLADLDNRSRAVEADPRSPGGRGFTGLEALLQYVFNQSMAINTFAPFGHLLAVDAFQSGMCSPYASPATVAANLKQYGAAYRQCYSWLGPNQAGVNEPDPSNPGGCVPDPGGAPPGRTGPQTSARACPAPFLSTNPPSSASKPASKPPAGGASTTPSSPLPGTTTPTVPIPGAGSLLPHPGPPSLPGVLNKVTSAVGAATGVTTPSTPTTPSASPPASSNTASGTPSAQQAQQLLNYLLSP